MPPTYLFLLSCCLIQLLANPFGGGATLSEVSLNKDDINQWVNSLADDFEAMRLKLGIESMESAFEVNGVSSGSVTEDQGRTMIGDIKKRLEQFFYKNEEHVARVRNEAELSFARHVFRNYSANCVELLDQPFLRAMAITKLRPDRPGDSPPDHQASSNVSSQQPQVSNPQQPTIITVVPQPDASENQCSAPTLMEMTPDPRVYNVDTNRLTSTAHVPSNIYDASTEILNVANWSRVLDPVFISNARLDPMLKWQYFGNIEGLLKIYPGIHWYIQTRELSNKDTTIDFFDCRTQYWYLLAATYPKDMVILIDNSGSMKGRRSIIANMTLTELLYTLNVNDYFNVIMLMNSSVKYISDSFNFTMLQATEKNKYTMMEMIKEDEYRNQSERRFPPLGMSDYKEALEEAFELLKYVKTNATHMSSGGVQNIVLITDDAPQTFTEVFQQLNPERQVRVFTFLVGREAAEEDTVKQIACANRGYFVHISTLSDVKENVQRYIPVIARTNAHARDYYFVWTGVHRNQIKTQNPNAPRVSHSAAESAAAAAASGGGSGGGGSGGHGGGGGGGGGYTVYPFSDSSSSTFSTAAPTAAPKPNPVNGTQQQGQQKISVTYKPRMDSGPHVIQEEDPAVKNRLFVSVAQSAYDTRYNETLSRGIGRLIGVAGIDVPTEHLERLGPAWELGSLGYIFIVTNNGHILFHPEFRPFDNYGNLRTFFNNRDVADIEYPADDEPLYNTPNYSLPLRLSLIQREDGSTEIDRIKTYEDFTRAFKHKFKYFYTPLNSTSPDGSVTRATPFSLALALPWRDGKQYPLPLRYPQARSVKTHDLTEDELNRLIARLFNSTCEPPGQSEHRTGLVDYEFCEFPSNYLKEYNKNPICALSRVLQTSLANQTAMKCVEAFLTRVYTDALSTESAQTNWQTVDNATLQRFGASQFFLWTNNGLIRWQNHTMPLRRDFISGQRNGSRELLYEKTVLLSLDSEAPMSVISVPPSHVVQDNIKSNVTYPRAFPVYLTSLIRTKEGRSPIGLAGVELDYARLEEIFLRATNTCVGTSSGPCVTCSQLNVRCYLLDHASFVVVSETRQDVGKAFDQVNCAAMRALVRENLYESIRAFDYQSICVRKDLIAAASSTLSNPLRALTRFASWVLVEGFLALSDMTSSIFQTIRTAAQDLLIQMSKETCDQVESRKPYQLYDLRKKIDNRVDEVVEAIRPKPPNEKIDEVKKSLVQPYCIAMQGKDQEGCDHLCRRVKEKFQVNIYNDMIGNCPKRIVKDVDCVLRRNLVKWTGKVPLDNAPVVRGCSDFGYCAGDSCPNNDASKLQIHVRPLPKTNLVFVAVVGDPNCDCRGCEDIVGTAELSRGPVNYTAPPVPRARPPWGLKSIVLRDNATACSKRAVVDARPLSVTLHAFLAITALVTTVIGQ